MKKKTLFSHLPLLGIVEISAWYCIQRYTHMPMYFSMVLHKTIWIAFCMFLLFGIFSTYFVKIQYNRRRSRATFAHVNTRAQLEAAPPGHRRTE
jgi:hypothetical protein